MIGRIYEADDRRAAVRALHGCELRRLILAAWAVLSTPTASRDVAAVVLLHAAHEFRRRLEISWERRIGSARIRRAMAEREYLSLLRECGTWHARRDQLEDEA